ncbi:hypothetical protein JXI42_08265 [bacterium]|nr:hypothetical protein [bacterium]
MKKLYIIMFLLLLNSLVLSVPRLINYQGKVTDIDGVGLNDTVDINVRLYPDSLGGTYSWQETHYDVPVLKGLFDIRLGSVNPLGLDFSSDEYWLRVSVDGDILSPRQRLVSEVFAIRSIYADSANAAIVNWDTLNAYLDTTYTPPPGGGPDKFTATLLVSSLPDNSGNFVCDGTADQVQINSALDSLATLGGGELYIKSGIYVISEAININSSGITIRGAGWGTYIRPGPGNDISIISVNGVEESPIYGIKIEQLT